MADITILGVHSLSEFESAARQKPYQLVTGDGALRILFPMSDAQAEVCLRNCTYAHSFGAEGRQVEDLLDEFLERLEFYKDDRFFPTVSDIRSEELIWVMLSQSHETRRLIALSDKEDFQLDVAAWFDRAKAELAEEQL